MTKSKKIALTLQVNSEGASFFDISIVDMSRKNPYVRNDHLMSNITFKYIDIFIKKRREQFNKTGN